MSLSKSRFPGLEPSTKGVERTSHTRTKGGSLRALPKPSFCRHQLHLSVDEKRKGRRERLGPWARAAGSDFRIKSSYFCWPPSTARFKPPFRLINAKQASPFLCPARASSPDATNKPASFSRQEPKGNACYSADATNCSLVS